MEIEKDALPWPGAKRAAGTGRCKNCGHSDPHYVAAGQDICTHDARNCDCEHYDPETPTESPPVARSEEDELLEDLPRPSLAAARAAAMALRSRPMRQVVPKEMLLPFTRSEDSGYLGLGYARVYSTEPQVIFKPKGLMIWGAPDDAEVMHVKIGRSPQLTATWGPIPARWFSTFQSYEEVAKAIEEGKMPAGFGHFDVIQRGMTVEVHIQSKEKLPPTKILMWGLGIE